MTRYIRNTHPVDPDGLRMGHVNPIFPELRPHEAVDGDIVEITPNLAGVSNLCYSFDGPVGLTAEGLDLFGVNFDSSAKGPLFKDCSHVFTGVGLRFVTASNPTIYVDHTTVIYFMAFRHDDGNYLNNNPNPNPSYIWGYETQASDVAFYTVWFSENPNPHIFITYDAQNGSQPYQVGAELNSLVTEPMKPTKPGFSFLGWLKPNSTAYWNFSTDVTTDQNFTLTGAWLEDVHLASVEITPDSGLYKSPQLVSLACDTVGAEIYYTLDKTDPLALADNGLEYRGTRYTGSFEVLRSTVVTAKATILDNNNQPLVAEGSATYSIGFIPWDFEVDQVFRSETLIAQWELEANSNRLKPVHFSVVSQVFHDNITVALSSVDEDVSIYYTLDGSEPTEASQLYTNPLILQSTAELSAKAFKLNTPESIQGVAYFTKYTSHGVR